MPSAAPITSAPVTDVPSFSPSKGPTDAPSSVPSAAPITSAPVVAVGDQGDICSSGFVYCPGRSQCLTGQGNGWVIEYHESQGTVEDCSIYIGVGAECDTTSATEVGTFTISPTMVHYSLHPGMYESNSFHFYAGICMGNDGGYHLNNNETCSDADIESFSGRWDTYPLVEECRDSTNDFSFQDGDTSTGVWTQDYQVFPVGAACRSFMTAHAMICQVVTPGAGL